MLIDINKIKASDRIRKDFGDIKELANDIKDNGLINPPTVTPEFELIAGERRLRACKFLEYPQIEVRVMAVEDEEHQLKLEISENENRKEFSYSERMDWAKRLERIERIKAEKRMKWGLKRGAESSDVDYLLKQGRRGCTRDIVGEVSGFGSGRQYEKAKFIHDNATEDIIKKLDSGEFSIHRAWLKTKKMLDPKHEKPEMSGRTSSEQGTFRQALINKTTLQGECECYICSFDLIPILEAHHIIPVSQSGSNEVDNGVLLCPTCHMLVERGRSQSVLKEYGLDYVNDWVIRNMTSEQVERLNILWEAIGKVGILVECAKEK